MPFLHSTKAALVKVTHDLHGAQSSQQWVLRPPLIHIQHVTFIPSVQLTAPTFLQPPTQNSHDL